ncbi:MAG TPA: carboxypeptidase-like regulatory domain-containing protein [Longimicrobium sp.]|nr:carboxypeptidase-like regulatory domain-containing protein [Longimicrobium sp.]
MTSCLSRPSRIRAVAPAFLFALLISACSQGTGSPQPGRGTLVSGHVQSLAGRPVSGAQVQVAGGGTAVTDAQGRFTIAGARPDERVAVTVTSDSFALASTAYPVRAGYETVANFELIPRAPAQRLDAGRGGRVAVGRTGSLEIAPGSLVDAQERPVQGDVFVSATYIDPADPRQVRAAPGNYTAVDSLGGRGLLRTSGMVDIRVVDTSGSELRLARGRTVALDWPPVERGGDGGVYRLVAGDWRFAGPRTGPTILPGLGNWNWDSLWGYACLRVRVLPTTTGILVNASGPGWNTSGTTNSNGVAMLPVEPGGQVTIYTSAGPTAVVSIPPGAGIPYGQGILSCPTDGGVTDATLSVVPLPPSVPGRATYRASGLYLRAF